MYGVTIVVAMYVCIVVSVKQRSVLFVVVVVVVVVFTINYFEL